MTVDPRRLARALLLRSEHLPDGRVLVTGGSEPRVVDPNEAVPCTCPDAQLRGVISCKHALAAELASLRPELREALQALAGAAIRRAA